MSLTNSVSLSDTQRIFRLFLIVPVVLFLLWASFSLFENNSADTIMVIQYPSGTLAIHTMAGPKLQLFGRVTTYKKRRQLYFDLPKMDDGKPVSDDTTIKIRFNDGGHAAVEGSIAWEMPTNPDLISTLHQKYGSDEAIDRQLIRTVVEKSIYMTGPLMSSKESYAERRNDLIQLINDQIEHGVYQTTSEEVKEADPITGEPKTVRIVKLKVDSTGHYERQDRSPLTDYGIRTFNLSIKQVKYDATVEAQIQTQQVAIMQVQTAIADAKKAEQAAITAEKNGQAEATKAKWEQEVIKARTVTEAQQKLEVAGLAAKEAEQYKQSEILRRQGEAERKRLVMSADGALDKKLAAYVQVQQAYAEALKEGHVQLVPSIVSGGTAGSPNGLNLIEILGIKAARDLAVDLSASGSAQTNSKR